MSGLFDAKAPGLFVGAEAVTMPFGKHKGMPLGWIAEHDVLYLDWLVGQEIRAEWLRTAVRAVCEKHADAIDRAVEERER